MSGAPSLANSLHSFASSNSSKLSLSSKSKQSNAVEDGSVVTDLLEKAKFYTSLCLGTALELIPAYMANMQTAINHFH